MKNKFVELHSIGEAHKQFGYGKPRHPLVSFLDFTKIKPEVVEADAFYQMSFYTISCKDLKVFSIMANLIMILMREH